MKVSVIIPTYNRADMVTGAVDSVLDQEGMEGVEIIVVDDGSSDQTQRVLSERYQGRITCLETGHQGPAGARNAGMRAARGEYIAWLDSDDLYRPFKLALQCGVLDGHPEVGMVFTECSGFDDNGFHDEWHLKKYHCSAYARGVSYERLFSTSVPLSKTPYGLSSLAEKHPDWLSKRIWFGEIYEVYLFNTVVFTNSMVFRRSLLGKTGLQQGRFGMFHDLEFALRLCRAAPVAFIDIPTYSLRYHHGQVSGPHGPSGQGIWIRKQRDLLRVFRAHTRPESRPETVRDGEVAAHTCRLCRAVAMPLLAFDKGTPHQQRAYCRRARVYLRACYRAGTPQRFLWLLSFMPHTVRRVGFKIMDLKERWRRRDRAGYQC